MAVWYSVWSFGIFSPFWFVWTKKNLATLTQIGFILAGKMTLRAGEQLAKDCEADIRCSEQL
jgi:hypothetical protein